jgi:Cu/Ag efflux protein CusF
MDSSNLRAAGRIVCAYFCREKAGLSTLNEGQKVEFEIVSNRGKSSAENLKVK